MEGSQTLVKAGEGAGLSVGQELVLLGPELAGTSNRQIVGTAKVAELWPDLARVEVARSRPEGPAPEVARPRTPEDDAAIDAAFAPEPTAKTKRPPEGADTLPPDETPNVPADLTSGTVDARMEALERHEREPDMTGAIVWVMKNDPSDEVRFKAWRVVRARWNRGTGSASAHEAATVWASTSGPERTRIEALELLGEKASTLTGPARSLGAGSASVRVAAGAAIRDIGKRTGKSSDARRMLEARRDVEPDSSVRKKLGDFAGDL